MQAVKVEIPKGVEEALRRIERGEGTHDDLNLLRAVYLQLQNEVRQLRRELKEMRKAVEYER